MILRGPEPFPACSSLRARSQEPKADASSVNPRPSRANTEKEPSRTHVYR
jgi:hypothetical protein